MPFDSKNRREFLQTSILGGIAALLLPSSLYGARTLTKNVSNYLRFPGGTFAALVSGKAKLSVAAWCKPASLTNSSGDNQIFNSVMAATGGLFRLGFGSNPIKVQLGGKSVNTDALQNQNGATTVSAGSLTHIGGVIDLTNKIMRVYLNGAQDGSASKTFANATFTPGAATANDWIGAQGTTTPGATANQFDGTIADVCLWGDDITSDGFLQLSKGYHPTLINPQNLLSYFPLIGNNSPETDVMGSGAQGTIVGSVPLGDHPKLIY